MTIRLIEGDALAHLATLPERSMQACVTSPPYFGLRDYGVERQIGLEATPDEYITALVAVFAEVRRVLSDDGTLWLNIGDSYDASKNLRGIPWRLALALRRDGWTLRQDIIWHKPNPMPESVQDRCTKAHEYLFLLSKSAHYQFDAAAIAEPALAGYAGSRFDSTKTALHQLSRGGRGAREDRGTANKRSVWSVPTHPYAGAHFATFPPRLVEPCILAGCPPQGTVLDPFAGAGTTGLVADRLQRDATLIELNPEYIELAKQRIFDDAPLFAAVC